MRSWRSTAGPGLRALPRWAAAPRPVAGTHVCLCRCSSSSAGAAAAATPPTPPKTPPPPLPPQAPQAILDIRHIRENVDRHAANCVRRNYGAMAGYPARIVDLFAQWQARQKEGRSLREQANSVRRQLVNAPGARDADDGPAGGQGGQGEQGAEDGGRARLLDTARVLKQQLAAIKADETRLTAEMQRLAVALPNLTSDATPDAAETVLSYINCDAAAAEGRPSVPPSSPSSSATATAAAALAAPDRWRSHVHIGSELGLMDFAAAAAASGWGWYYLLGDGARLEQALVQYALDVARRHGWQLVAPPSIVRSGIAAACGFQPRDQGGEQQTYAVEGQPLSLTATAEIPLAALFADATLDAGRLPLRRAAVSRCFRAEAGARGASTKGLYRVHEFTKVELFAWTAPDLDAATDTFDELVDVQTEILQGLGLPCRVLEMPATDLGASAFRKIDIEAFFPGRCRPKAPPPGRDAAGSRPQDYDYATGWGEVTSASICTDYQTRRLATRTRSDGGPLAFPWTLNGTAMAVPRVLAALLENGWDEESMTVAIPECLRPWMDGQATIGLKHRLR